MEEYTSFTLPQRPEGSLSTLADMALVTVWVMLSKGTSTNE